MTIRSKNQTFARSLRVTAGLAPIHGTVMSHRAGHAQDDCLHVAARDMSHVAGFPCH